MAKLLIVIGIILVCLGLLWHYAPWTLNWIGQLPGDIRIESGNTRIFFPITSMVIISIVITLIVHWLNK